MHSRRCGLVVFIANATVICSLGHGLHTFTAVIRSTQPCGLLLSVFHMPVCLLTATVSNTKMTEPIEVLLGVWSHLDQRTM